MSASEPALRAPPRGLVVEHLAVRGFRNVASLELRPSRRLTVVSGDNGQGKTSLLEALYVAATAKSFRTARIAEVVKFGSAAAHVKLAIDEAGLARTQAVGVEGSRRAPVLDGKRPRSLAVFAVASPVVVFHPGELSLSAGPSQERRRLLDRAGLFLAPSSLDALERYGKALRARQKLLESGRPSESAIAAWEELVVRHGLEVRATRARAAAELAPRVVEAFARIGAPGLDLAVTYVPGAPEGEDAFARALFEDRAADARRGAARTGPHKDDLALVLAGHPARTTASQGQHRALVLALKAAEIAVVEQARGLRPVLLLDDVSSELDRERTRALFRFLDAHEGQVFLSTTRPDLIEAGERALDERVDVVLEGGAARVLDGPPAPP